MTYDSNARKAYKAQARADIRANFWVTMAAVLVELVPLFLISMIMLVAVNGISDNPTMAEMLRLYQYLGIYVVASFLIGGPITFGAKHYFVARARGEQCSVSQVLTCFSSLKKYLTSLKLSLCIALRSLGWLLLLYAVMFVTLLPLLFITNGGLADLLMLVWAVIMIVLALFIGVKIRRYDGAYICMIDTPDASVWEAVQACVPIFKGHNWELMLFDLSFLLWGLASMITLGIVGVYATAYQEISFVHYFDALCGREKHEPVYPPEMPEQ
ncbi:MAG: DUF975 family protein [Eubacteriales bacterium]|nr:DUF975 family protein [Eubacteriales bacterium]